MASQPKAGTNYGEIVGSVTLVASTAPYRLTGGSGGASFCRSEYIISYTGAKAMRRVEKPWGYELIWVHTQKYVGKVLHVNAGARLSLQYHRLKDETLYVQQGRIELLLGTHIVGSQIVGAHSVGEDEGSLKKLELGPGQSQHIPPGTPHRLTALTDTDIFEVSTPELEDVVRLEDDYGRVG